jgi:predicted patatin/cPLA2 family phospholipase
VKTQRMKQFVEETFLHLEKLYESWLTLYHEVKAIIHQPRPNASNTTTIDPITLRIKQFQKDLIVLEVSYNLYVNHDDVWSKVWDDVSESKLSFSKKKRQLCRR